jgi:propionyl-CoA carboxylase alpha chain
MEARVCAEEPARNFIPSVGLITRYAEPFGEHIRTDSGVSVGSTVSIYYDSMLSKVITWGEDRESARKRMIKALNGYHIEGIITNINYLNLIAGHPAFAGGDLSTDFIERHLTDPETMLPPDAENLRIMALATTLVHHLRDDLVKNSLLPLIPRVGGVKAPKMVHDYIARSDRDIFEIRLERKPASEFLWTFDVDGITYDVMTPPMEFYRRRLKLTINGQTHYFRLRYNGSFIVASFTGIVRTFEIYNPREWALAKYMPKPVQKTIENILVCPMPGLVVETRATPGERVYKGQELVIIESMKMETSVASHLDAVVKEIHVVPGDTVETGSVMITFR